MPVIRGTPWTSGEIARLRELAAFGVQVAAAELGRSRYSVETMAKRQRISLRQPGSRRGRVLGQALGERASDHPIVARIREDALAGRIDIDRVDRLVALATAGADLCPSCTNRPIEVESAGLCVNCHLRELTQAHESEVDRIHAARQLDAARQRKHRARKRDRREEMSA